VLLLVYELQQFVVLQGLPSFERAHARPAWLLYQ